MIIRSGSSIDSIVCSKIKRRSEKNALTCQKGKKHVSRIKFFDMLDQFCFFYFSLSHFYASIFICVALSISGLFIFFFLCYVLFWWHQHRFNVFSSSVFITLHLFWFILPSRTQFVVVSKFMRFLIFGRIEFILDF